MKTAQNFYVELSKGRHRKLFLLPLGFLFVLFLWASYSNNDLTPYEQAQGYTFLFYQLPLLNCVLMPILIAVIASRLCDMEIKGGTLKLLYTLENKSCFYDLKFLHEFLYVFLFAVGEGLLIPVMGHIFHFTESLSIALLLRHVLCLLLASVPVLCLQHLLSLMEVNQIAPLFLGLVGSFLGLFSMFFSPAVAHFVLWAYFGAFLPYGMDYDPSSRIISFYQVPFPLPVFIVFLIFTILLYVVCRKIFLSKEV